MNIWENRVTMPDGKIAPYHQGPNVRRFRLVAEPIQHNLLPEITINALGYNATTPGPLLIAKQGEWVQIEVVNKMDHRTALHVHGLSKPNSQDGVPEIEPTPFIQPGDSFTYQFQAWQVGSFFYHSSEGFQISQGLIGPFIVLPREQNIPLSSIPNHDYIMLLQQWQIPQPELGKITPGTYTPSKFDQKPNFFTINGKSFPATSPIYTRSGEKVRIRFINKSSSSHSMHVHGHDFQVVQINGFERENLMDDTINVASGQRWDIEFISNNPGSWPINGTKTFHQSNNGKSPGGMITRLKYTD